MNKDERAYTLKERALFFISPEKGENAYRERQKRQAAQGKDQSQPTKMASTGYGNHGASTTLNSLIGWLAGGGSAEDDVDLHGATLRIRARDLYAGGGLARSGPATMTTNVVGWGIKPRPKIDGEYLGLSEEETDEWEINTLREFELWAGNAMCDAEQSKNFYAMQQLAFLNELMSGDVFILFGMRENKRTPYQTTIRLLEADRICTPGATDGESTSQETDGGGRIIDGVEIDREGKVIRFHVASRHPMTENANDEITWESIDAFGSDTGYPNILHIMTYERPEQRRGVPFVAGQIEKIKQLDRYINSELAANVVASFLTAFIESDEDDGKLGIDDDIDESEKVTEDELKLELAPGAVYSLPKGKHVKDINPIRNNASFDGFVSALETIIGASMEIPQEVLVKKYNSNYTAARGAMLDFWKKVRVYRTSFNEQFNQPIYEQWLSEAVAAGRIEAPGFFDDPIIRQAWCGCMWTGISMGHVDPLKEVNAAQKRIELNMSTEEQEASEYNGNDWQQNIRQRRKEMQAFNDMQTQEGTEE